MIQKPLEYFKEVYNNELVQAQTKIPGACCLSTVGEDGYPNSRFLALKDVDENGFIITGPFARKGKEIHKNSRVSLTFWWQTTEMQVRIQGDALPISSELCSKYFHERPRESQLTSWVSKQGHPLEDIDSLYKKLEEIKDEYKEREIHCPEDWVGFCIIPKRIEFLEFRADRLHNRTLYTRIEDSWRKEYLQP